MEEEYGLVGGNIFHGELSLEQLFHMRPAPGYADYRTPIAGLYNASSATHAGGGVCGIPGWQAARAVMKDQKRGQASAALAAAATGFVTACNPTPPSRRCFARARSRWSGRVRGRAASAPGWSPRSVAAPATAGPPGQPAVRHDRRPALPALAEAPGRAARPRPARRRRPRPRASNSRWRPTSGARSAVIFGSAHGAGAALDLRDIASDAGMALCGAGCMGFVNVADGLRAIGYLERADLPRGPIALVTHSGSVFSALLRTRRALGFTLAVSSGQELVTTTADYLDYVLDQTDTRVVALVLETVRDGARLVAGAAAGGRARHPGRAAARRRLTARIRDGEPHIPARWPATRASWEALAEGTGALLGRATWPSSPTRSNCSRSDGARAARSRHRHRPRLGRRTHAGRRSGARARRARSRRCPPTTLARLDDLLDDGLLAENPLDLWGTGAARAHCSRESLRRWAPTRPCRPSRSPSIWSRSTTATRPTSMRRSTSLRDVPLVVLTNLASAIDDAAAAPAACSRHSRCSKARAAGWSRCGTCSRWPTPRPVEPPVAVDAARRTGGWRGWTIRARWTALNRSALLADYGIPSCASQARGQRGRRGCRRGVDRLPGGAQDRRARIAHKSDVGGVLVGAGRRGGGAGGLPRPGRAARPARARQRYRPGGRRAGARRRATIPSSGRSSSSRPGACWPNCSAIGWWRCHRYRRAAPRICCDGCGFVRC